MGVLTWLLVGVMIYCLVSSLLNGDVKGALDIFFQGVRGLLLIGAIWAINNILYSVLGGAAMIFSIVLTLVLLFKFSP